MNTNYTSAPIFERIPPTLKDGAKWAVWKPEEREGGKVSKIPRNPHTGGAVSTTRPEEWVTYAECRDAVESGQYTGVGVLLDGSRVVGIDVDHLRETAETYPEVGALLKAARERGAYIEVSPGGNGVHVLVRGQMEAKGRRAGPLEVYSKDRFLTVTGNTRALAEVIEDQDTIDGALAIIDALSASKGAAQVEPRVTQGGATGEPDAELTDEIAGAVRVNQPLLWEGRWEDVGAGDLSAAKPFPSQSEADASLAAQIAREAAARGVAPDAIPLVVEAVFGKSGLVRDKWCDRADYRQRTIAMAVAGLGERTTGGGASAVRVSGADGERADVLNARAFAAEYRGRWAYVPERKKWLEFDTQVGVWRWQVPEEVRAAAVGVLTKKQRETVSNPNLAPEVARAQNAHWANSQRLPRIDAMVDLAATESGMLTRAAELDADPLLLGVQNGVVDLRTGKLLPPDPKRMVTQVCGAEFDADAKCPKWEAFMGQLFPGDAATVETLQRATGYTLTGLNTEEVMFICVGHGANGKSVFSNVVSRVLGGYGKTGAPTLLTARDANDTGARNDMAAVCGARLVSVNESQSGDRLDERVVKQLVGREPVSARFLYGEFFEYTPTFKVWMRTNHRPVITGTDHGIWRRIVLVEFNRMFERHEQNPNLEAELMSERSGILNWMLRGAALYLKDGLKLSPAIKQATGGYRKESDLLGQFLTDLTVSGPNTRVVQSDLWGAWRNWCTANGISCGSRAAFGRRLQERGIESSVSNGMRYYTGVRMRRSEECPLVKSSEETWAVL